MPAPHPNTHLSLRGMTSAAMRPTAYSGIRSSFAAFPVPKEKDATPRAYRGVAS
jgi:hypothetical protein